VAPAARSPRPRKPAAQARRTPDRARRLAFDALRKVHGDGAYANLALAELLTERTLPARDAAFATELVSGTCRLQGTYDQVISAAADRPLNSFQPAVLDLLRLGAHQILSLRVPIHAAVAAMVDLAAATVGERVTGLTNAVLRRVAAQDLEGWLDQLSAGRDPRDVLALRSSHPRWIVDAFADLLPGSELEPALAADNLSPDVTLVVRPGLADLAELTAAGAVPVSYSPFAARWSGPPGELAAVREGRAGVQDEGSQLVAWALTRAQAPTGPWLDLCSGPGGKTAMLTGLAAGADGPVVAVEPSAHRAALVAAAGRAYPRRPAVLQADGTRPAWRPGSFSRVLADVPCTGLGALRRRPESRWRRGPGDVEQLHGLQRALLAAALDATVAGGVVAYVTCSPHRRETADVVTETLAQRSDVTLIPAADLLPEVPDAASGDFLQLWPHRHGTDAMFAAYLRVG
jgi:16S rRNA (cytosine967-C5)-methyltransferase